MKARSIRQKARTELSAVTERAASIDLDGLPELRSMKEFTNEFLGDELPSAMDCKDVANWSYKSAHALLYCCAATAEQMREDGPTTGDVEIPFLCDAINLQLQKLFVSHKRLQEIQERTERLLNQKRD